MCSGNGEPRVSEALLDAAVDTSIRAIESLEEKTANQEKELAELRPATAQARQENAVLSATVDRLERELQDHVDAIAGLTIDKTNLETDLQAMRERADTLGQEAENLEAVLEKQYQSAAELVLQRDEARSKLRALQAETDPAVALLAFLQGLYAVTTAKEVEEAVRQDKQTLAGLSEELELAHRDLEKKDRLVDQIRKAAAENRRQLEVVTADRDKRATQAQDLTHQLEQAKARATADTVEVSQLITQRVELVERAKSVARSAGLPAPTDLKAVEEFLVDLAVARNEARNALDSKVQDLTADRDRLLAVGRELAERFPGNPPESLKDLAGLLTEVLAKEEERVGVLNGHQELSKRRDLVLKAGRELAQAHGEEPPEDLEELATLLGQLARQELVLRREPVAGEVETLRLELAHTENQVRSLQEQLDLDSQALVQAEDQVKDLEAQQEKNRMAVALADENSLALVKADRAVARLTDEVRIWKRRAGEFMAEQAADRQEPRDGLPTREALLVETREQRQQLEAMAHQVTELEALAEKRELEVAEEVARVEDLKKRLAHQTDHLDHLQADLTDVRRERDDHLQARNSLRASVSSQTDILEDLLEVFQVATINALPGVARKERREAVGLHQELVVARNDLRKAQAENEQLATELDGVRETVKDLQVRLHGAQEAHDLRKGDLRLVYQALAKALGQPTEEEGVPGGRWLRAMVEDLARALQEKAVRVVTTDLQEKDAKEAWAKAEAYEKELASLKEIFRQLQELYDVTPRAMVLAKAQAERNEVDTLRRELSETLAEVEDLKGRLADQKEATEVAEHDGGLDMKRAAELDTTLQETADNLAALWREVAEKDKVLATLQESYEVSNWTDLPAASAILHRRFGEIVQERDQLRRERTGLSQARDHYRQERDELAQRLRTQAAADQGGDRQELAYLRGELKLVRSALLTALGREAEDTDEPVVPVHLRDMVVQLRSMMGHHKARDERLSQELDNRHFDTQELEALRSERDRLKEDRDRLLQAERMAVQEADHLRVELSQARDQAQVDAARFAGLETRVEAEAAQRAALKVERDHLARELAETTVAEGRASSAAQDLSSHLNGALAEMERLSQRFLESEAERFELWSERMAWSTDQTRLLGQVKDLEAELAETKSSLKTTSAKLAATLEEERSQADESRHQAEVAAHALTRVCLEDVDIVRDGLERCGCEDCTEALRRLVKVGYLPVRRSKRQEVDDED